MSNFLKNIVIAAALAFSFAMPAAAQEQPLSLKGEVKLVKTEVVEGGETKTELLDPANNPIVPGDRLLFGTDFENVSGEEVTGFVMTNPLPKPVRLAPDADPDLVVSADGGQTWGKLAELTVSDENGESRAAAHADVTHIRWTLDVVAPGQSGRLEYPAIIR